MSQERFRVAVLILLAGLIAVLYLRLPGRATSPRYQFQAVRSGELGMGAYVFDPVTGKVYWAHGMFPWKESNPVKGEREWIPKPTTTTGSQVSKSRPGPTLDPDPFRVDQWFVEHPEELPVWAQKWLHDHPEERTPWRLRQIFDSYRTWKERNPEGDDREFTPPKATPFDWDATRRRIEELSATIGDRRSAEAGAASR